MKFFRLLLFCLVNAIAMTLYGQNDQEFVPPKHIQIKLAVQAAPAEMEEGARVLGYNKKKELVTIRKGKNDLICLADDPARNNIHVSCYFKDLEPFMARGRELAAEGYSNEDRQRIRGEEADSGKLKLPEKPAGLYVFDADQTDVDMTTGEVSKGRLRSVIYIPYLTGDESGLPTEPVGGGMPWLMDAGTHKAHIMITPN